MAIVGKCPYCDGGLVSWEKKPVRGKPTKIYTCSNARWMSEDGEMFELTKDSTCSFRIWGNSLLRWGKRGIGVYEVKQLLKNEEVVVRLYSMSAKKEYFKYITLDEEYGVSVLWDIDVDENQNI